MLRIVVLGAAAGGGVPQWNCGCPVCLTARSENPGLQSTQASIAFSADNEHWFLVNASPDLRQQLIATPQLHPRHGQLRHSPIAGVILTNGEIDAVAGLLSMREGSPFSIYAHARVLAIPRVQQHLQRAGRKERASGCRSRSDRPFQPALPDGSPSGLEVLRFRGSRQGRLVSRGQGASGRRRRLRATRWACGLRTRPAGNTSTSSPPARVSPTNLKSAARRRAAGLLRRHGVARR